jgi:hypothetical protein
VAAHERMELGGWRLGLDPAGSGSVIRMMTRVELPIGDAIRIEMADPSSDGVVHVQYFIATDAGGWALWIACQASMLAAFETALTTITLPPADGDPTDQSR